jgi:cytidylate kinase
MVTGLSPLRERSDPWEMRLPPNCRRVFDREIVDTIAQNNHVRQDLVRELDERSQSLIHDTVARLLLMASGISFGNEEYHDALLKTLALLAARGEAIIVGRGSACALQGEPGLHLRFVASPEIRISRLAQQWGVSSEAARRRMEQIDAGRRNFVHNHFRQSLDDIRFYDAVFNTDRQTAEQIADAVMGMIVLPEQAHRYVGKAAHGTAAGKTTAPQVIPPGPPAGH